MQNINKTFIGGRVVRDAEMRYGRTGGAVTKFSLAYNRSKKTGDGWAEEAHFVDVVIFGRTAEAITQYLIKGKQVFVEGSLVHQRWEDQQTGSPRSKHEIIADLVELGNDPRGQGGGRVDYYEPQGRAPRDDYQRPQAQQVRPPQRGPARSAPSQQQELHPEGFEDDIPF